ncbi:MAG: hypothetical protein ACD_54C00440G0005, partial [uncultured bacterium]
MTKGSAGYSSGRTMRRLCAGMDQPHQAASIRAAVRS